MPRVSRRPTAARGTRSHRAAAVTLLGTLLLAVAAPTADAQGTNGSVADPVAVARRAGDAWLAGQQQADGGFAVAGLPGVETPETVLAHAGEVQASDVWSSREALDGIDALGSRDGGPTVLQALSTLARTTTTATDASLLITRVVLPLGLDPQVFDPANEGQPVDLVAVLAGATPADPVDDLSDIVVALVGLGEDVPAEMVAAIVDATRPDGAWAAPADADETDVTTTADAIVALIAAGVAPDDERVAPGLVTLAGLQHEDGGWGPDGGSAPVATAAAMRALRAAGYDPDETCWQDDLLPDASDRPTPSAQLTATQADAGYWGSDEEALSTAVVVQALGDRWLPTTRADARTCGGGLSWPLPDVPPGILVIVVITVVVGYGAVRILRDPEFAL